MSIRTLICGLSIAITALLMLGASRVASSAPAQRDDGGVNVRNDEDGGRTQQMDSGRTQGDDGGRHATNNDGGRIHQGRDSGTHQDDRDR